MPRDPRGTGTGSVKISPSSSWKTISSPRVARAAASPSQVSDSAEPASRKGARHSCCPGRSARRAACGASGRWRRHRPHPRARRSSRRSRDRFKSRNALLLSASQALVDAADRGARSIIERQDRAVLVTRQRRGDIDLAVALRPSEDGLNFESLPLPILVVRRDPFGRLVSTLSMRSSIADGMDAAHAGAAGVTTFGLVS